LELGVGEHSLEFAEHEVVIARSTPEQLGRVIANTDSRRSIDRGSVLSNTRAHPRAADEQHPLAALEGTAQTVRTVEIAIADRCAKSASFSGLRLIRMRSSAGTRCNNFWTAAMRRSSRRWIRLHR